MTLPRLSSLVIALLLAAGGSAQSTTKNDAPGTSTTTSTSGKKKVLLVPCPAKMYMSEIDQSINKETGQTAQAIRTAMRKGVNDQLKKQFNSSYSVVSLLDDTSSSVAKDLGYINNVTTTEYTAVDDPLKADAVKTYNTTTTTTVTTTGSSGTTTTNTTTGSKTSTGTTSTNPNVSKGQITSQSDDREKFMNTLILSPNLLAYLKKKYNADYVVFVNEIDLKNDLGDDPANLSASSTYKRSATIHYTCVDAATSKRVAAGLAKSTFENTVNKPQKISDDVFSACAKTLYTKFSAGVK